MQRPISDVEEFPSGRSEQSDLLVEVDNSTACPPTDLASVVPSVSYTTSDSVVLSFDGYAKLELSPHRPDVLTVNPDLGYRAPDIQLSAVLKALLHSAAKSRRAIFHASAIEADGRGLLFLGDSRAGKSTFAVMASLEYSSLLSDDLVLIEEGIDGPICYAARDHFTLRQDIAESCPQLPLKKIRKITTPEGAKYVISREAGVVRTVTSMSLDHILFCNGLGADKKTIVRALTSAEYYALLLKSFFPMFGKNFRLFREEQKKTMELVSLLHSNATGYSIEIGGDILESPVLTLNNLMDQLS